MVLNVLSYALDDKPEKSEWPCLLSSFLIPGTGQLFQGHPVKGVTVLTVDLAIIGSGLNDGYYFMNKWQKRYDESAQNNNIDSMEYFGGQLEYSKAIRDRTIAWVAGIHTFSFLDCYHNYHKAAQEADDEVRSPRGALIRSMVLPGWGQFYNHQYSKLGLLIMAAAGFTANLTVWQRTAGYYLRLEEKYRGQADAYAPRLEEINEQIADYQESLNAITEALKDSLPQVSRDSLFALQTDLQSKQGNAAGHRDTLSAERSALSDKVSGPDGRSGYQGKKKDFYSNRNENIWYLVALYFYAAFDAYVDAQFSGFNRKLDLGLTPSAEGLSVTATYRF